MAGLLAGLLAGLNIALYGVRRSAAAEVLQIPCLVLEVPLPSAGGKTQVVGSFRRPLEHRPIKAAVLPAKSTIARGSAGNLCDLAQKTGDGARSLIVARGHHVCSPLVTAACLTHHARFTRLIAANAKNSNGAGGYEGRALSRWDGAPSGAHCVVDCICQNRYSTPRL